MPDSPPEEKWLPTVVLKGDREQFEHLTILESVVAKRPIVLIVGETGTGKSTLARHLHSLAYGHRHADKRRAIEKEEIDHVNLAAVPPDLVESELFGHVAGAFTGAQSEREGRIAEAHGGTLFLDEIGHSSPSTQAKLLTVIERKIVVPVGFDPSLHSRKKVRARKVAVWYVAATSRPERLIPELYWRLAGVVLELRPLRGNPEAIELFATEFLRQALESDEEGERSTPRELSAEALGMMKAHGWPGNHRQLRAVMERVVLLSGRFKSDEVSAAEVRRALDMDAGVFGISSSGKAVPANCLSELREVIRNTPPESLPKRKEIESLLAEAYREALGNWSRAAKQLQVARGTIQNWRVPSKE